MRYIKLAANDHHTIEVPRVPDLDGQVIDDALWAIEDDLAVLNTQIETKMTDLAERISSLFNGVEVKVTKTPS